MERLTVGNNRPFPGKTTLTRVPPPSRCYPPSITAPHGRENHPPAKDPPERPGREPPKEPPKASSGSSSCREKDRPPHGRESAGAVSRSLLSSLPTPDQPLLRLMGRDIYPEDLMLVLLILTLKEDNADPGLVAALVYLLFC